MESSDDEAEEFPEVVSQYYFEDDKEEPISFAVLPVCWNTNEAVQSMGKKVYVRGKTDNGLHKLYKPVKAWKFDISGEKPEISVLCEGNNWIKLQKPRNSYEDFGRTVLITVNFLHLLKRNPELHGKGLWDELSKIFRLLDDKPSPDDLIDHKALIEKAVEHDDSLKKSKYLMMCLENNLQKENRDQENARSKGKNAFIVDDDCMADDLEEGASINGEFRSADRGDGSGDEEDVDEDIFDSVCCICDEGGSILCCDGICMRSFHATPRAAKEANSKCMSLGFSTKEVEAMQTFECQNCQHKLHQCYSCGLLGSSDKASGAEVFQCVNATCGYFYHPDCVAKQLHGDNVDAANALQKDIAAGEAFTCPLHMCVVCRQPENKTVSELRMAVCRRCPKAYHEKCLPGEIAFEDDDESIVQRAWDELLAGRILIYCLEHEISEDLGTPLRNHIKFPGDDKKEKQPFRQQLMKHQVIQKYKKPSVKALSRQGPAFEPRKILPDNHPCKTDVKIFKPKGTVTLRNLSVEKKSVLTNVELKSREQLDMVKASKFDKFSVKKSSPELDSDSETRILEFIDEASSKITLDDVIEKHQKLISCHAYKQKMDLCKSITLGKVEGSCKAIRAATVKLDAGNSIEDAKAICEPKILGQVVKWKTKLKVYLAPFLYGMRYTSFGRHFTKTDKLTEIVDKIHWYVDNNDTIVDFCCGANDFSLLMKKRLERMGKTCYYKNYDLFQAKHDFNFEKRDWMSVQPKELPPGSQLIMGLNPPFGVKARLANQFINKALEFKPKLLILIVPQETERLDKKKTPYDLIWEDRDKLSGKSFYLPGSVDKNEKQMEDWNVVAPVLYLWSRPDWTARHKAVAKKHCHLHGGESDMGNHANRQGHERSSERFEHVAVTKADDVSTVTDDHDRLKETAPGEKQTAINDHLREMHVINGDSSKKRHIEDINAEDVVKSSLEYKRPHLSPPLRYQRSSANMEIRDSGLEQFEPTSYGDGRLSRESQCYGFDHLEQSASNVGFRNGFEIPGSYYDRVGIHDPQIDIHPGGRSFVDAGPRVDYPLQVTPSGDYRSRIPDEWSPAYMRGPDGYGANQPFSAPGYSRMTPMSTMDKYDLRLDEPNRVRMSGYIPGLGHPSEPRMYNHPDPRQVYGASMGTGSEPLESSLMVSKGKGLKKHNRGKKTKAFKGNKKHVASTASTKPKGAGEQKCFYCNELGHWKRNCPTYLEDVKGSVTTTSGTKK